MFKQEGDGDERNEVGKGQDGARWRIEEYDRIGCMMRVI